MKKQPEITDKTRQTFINVFCDLYTQKPIQKISIQELSKLSGYNRSTFYQYFSDIYELLECIENDLLKYIQKEVERGNSTSKTKVEIVLRIFEEKQLYFDALLGEYGSVRFLERLKKEIPFASKEWGLSLENPITDYLIEYQLTTTYSLFRLWFQKKRDLSPEELFSLIESLHTLGIPDVVKKYQD